MRILYLSEDASILEDKSVGQNKILDYASFATFLFVVVSTKSKQETENIKKTASNVCIYGVNSSNVFKRILKVIRLLTYELKDRGIFQAELIVCEDQFVNAFIGYFFAQKFKKPLYVFFPEKTEKQFFLPKGFRQYIFSKISSFVLKKADCIKTETSQAKEKLLKKYPNLKIEVIKEFADANNIVNNFGIEIEKEKMEKSFLKKEFPYFKFTILTFVNNLEEVKLALDTLEKLNTHFPPNSLILLHSYNLTEEKIRNKIKQNLRAFVGARALDEKDVSFFLIDSNVFWGISSGETYEDVLNKACALGSTIIAKETEFSKNIIDNNATGFLCPPASKEEFIDYFTNKTLLIMNKPSLALEFKMNVSLYFKQKFTNTKEEYWNKLKASLEDCLAKHKKENEKYYRF